MGHTSWLRNSLPQLSGEETGFPEHPGDPSALSPSAERGWRSSSRWKMEEERKRKDEGPVPLPLLSDSNHFLSVFTCVASCENHFNTRVSMVKLLTEAEERKTHNHQLTHPSLSRGSEAQPNSASVSTPSIALHLQSPHPDSSTAFPQS